MTNGFMRTVIAVNATTSVDGYTLGLRIAPGLQVRIRQLVSETFLKSAFSLGPAPLTQPHLAYYTQQLDQRRIDNSDSGDTWSYPATGGGYQVSGTFGEWRGRNNEHVHRGLDLAAPVNTSALASRGGVVSSRGTLSGMGDYLVIDHGTGWFSRYLHLDASAIVVKKGQAVARGATLATRLYSIGSWPVHLHFEVRLGLNQAQWENDTPGVGKDPLQAAGIFSAPPGSAPPRVEEFGLTRQHPGQGAFVKSPPSANADGSVYVFGRLVDVEPKPGGDHRLGLKSMRFLPEGATSPSEIRPQDDDAIALLRLPGTAQQKGFARYSSTHAANPDRRNYFRYWWQWDTSSYSSNMKGPRTLSLIAEDYSGSAVNCDLTFGPRIKGDSLTLIEARTYMFTNVAYLGTNFLANPNQPDPNYSQPDQYRLQIIKADGSPLSESDVKWSGAMAGNVVTKVFTVHMEEAVYTFTLPPNTSPEGLNLTLLF